MFPDVVNRTLAVRLEDHLKELGENVVVVLTLSRGHFPAFGASTVTVLHATFAYFAPRSLFILEASGATSFLVFPAVVAIQSAERNSLWFFHIVLVIVQVIRLHPSPYWAFRERFPIIRQRYIL